MNNIKVLTKEEMKKLSSKWESLQVAHIIKEKFETSFKPLYMPDVFVYLSRRFGNGLEEFDRYKDLATWRLITPKKTLLTIYLSGDYVGIMAFITKEQYDKIDEEYRKNRVIEYPNESIGWHDPFDQDKNRKVIFNYIDETMDEIKDFLKPVAIRDVYYNILGKTSSPKTDEDYVSYLGEIK